MPSSLRVTPHKDDAKSFPLFFGFLWPYDQMQGPTPRMKEPTQNTEEDSIVE
jgi:hypothetical protein